MKPISALHFYQLLLYLFLSPQFSHCFVLPYIFSVAHPSGIPVGFAVRRNLQQLLPPVRLHCNRNRRTRDKIHPRLNRATYSSLVYHHTHTCGETIALFHISSHSLFSTCPFCLYLVREHQSRIQLKSLFYQPILKHPAATIANAYR